MATFYSLFPLTHPLNATTTSLIVSCEIFQCYNTPQHQPNAHGHRQHCPCLKCATDFPDVDIMGFEDFNADELRTCFFSLDLETWRRADARGEREGRHVSYEEQE